jgi:serine protease Do
VIISVAGRPVDYVAQLQEAIAFRKPGETVEVEVARKGGQRATFKIPLQRAQQAVAAAPPEETSPAAPSEPAVSTSSLGITVVTLDSATKSTLDVPQDVRGVIVMDVDDSSPAAGRLATPQTGGPDLILSVEGQPVTTPEALQDALRSAKPGDIVSLRIYNVQSKSRRIERVRVGSTAGR